MLEFSENPAVNDSIADKIVLESLYQLMPFQSLNGVAKNMLSADSLITGGLYNHHIFKAYGSPKNILQFIQLEEAVASSKPELFYANGFTIKIPKNQMYEYVFYTMNGKIIQSGCLKETSHFNIKEPLIIELKNSSGINTILKKF